MEKKEGDLKFVLDPSKPKLKKIRVNLPRFNWWIVLVFALCFLIFAVAVINVIMEVRDKALLKKEISDIRTEIKRVDLKATASLKASEDINYFANIILALDELTKGNVPDVEISEIAFMIYGTDKELDKLCGFNAGVALAMIEAESAGNPKAISPIIEAKGLWQLHDTTGKRVFTAIGYGIGNYYNEVFNPLKNSRGALYHIRKELYPYWSVKAPNKQLCLLYIIHSYRWGIKATERLRTSWKRDRMPGIAYTEKVLKRSIDFKKRLKRRSE